MFRNFNRFALLTLLIAAVALWPAAARASTITLGTITVQNEWQMGEQDLSPAIPPTPASAGATVLTAVDDLGTLNLTAKTASGQPNPVYATPSNPALPASTLCVSFPSNQINVPDNTAANQYLEYSGSAPAWTTAAAKNWGLDFWFYTANVPAAGDDATLLWLGNGSLALRIEIGGVDGGSGIALNNKDGDKEDFDTNATVPANQWNHLVYVDLNGVGTVYFNSATPLAGYTGVVTGGVAVANAQDWIDAPLSSLVGTGFNVGAQDPGQNGAPFNGEIDELRFFSLNTVGVFNYNDTLPVPEPSALALVGAGLAGLLTYAWRRRRC
jgi:hypothetical protein